MADSLTWRYFFSANRISLITTTESYNGQRRLPEWLCKLPIDWRIEKLHSPWWLNKFLCILQMQSMPLACLLWRAFPQIKVQRSLVRSSSKARTFSEHLTSRTSFIYVLESVKLTSAPLCMQCLVTVHPLWRPHHSNTAEDPGLFCCSVHLSYSKVLQLTSYVE